MPYIKNLLRTLLTLWFCVIPATGNANDLATLSNQLLSNDKAVQKEAAREIKRIFPYHDLKSGLPFALTWMQSEQEGVRLFAIGIFLPIRNIEKGEVN